MKKLILFAAVAAISVGGVVGAARAQEWGYDRGAYDRGGYYDRDDYRDRDPRWRGGSDELNRLNWDFDRIGNRLRSRGASRHVWERFRKLAAERDQLNWELRRGGMNPWRMSRRVEYLRSELRRLEFIHRTESGRNAIGVRVYPY